MKEEATSVAEAKAAGGMGEAEATSVAEASAVDGLGGGATGWAGAEDLVVEDLVTAG